MRLSRLPRDIHLKVANMTDDDESILNMLIANPKYDDEDYFMKLMNHRYPLLVKLKKDETWRNFYLRIIEVLALLIEEYDFPYIPHPRFNPFVFYRSLQPGFMRTVRDIYKIGLKYAAEIGDRKLVDHFLLKGASNIDEALIAAAKRGNIEMADYLIEKGATESAINVALGFASDKPHMDMIRYLVDVRKANDFDRLLRNAVISGHIDVVKYALEKGATELNGALQYARQTGRRDIIELIQSYIV